jgi:arylsulfatase A-like enzyme
LIENVDVFPTLAELCDIPMHQVDGKSIVPLLNKPKKKWNKAAYSLYNRGSIMGLTTTDGKWRYTEWRNSKDQSIIEAELYSCKVNFQEQSENFVGNPKYQKEEQRMKKLLVKEYAHDGEPFVFKKKKK